MRKFILIAQLLMFSLVGLGIGTTWAQEVADSVSVHFRQSSAVLDPAFGENGTRLGQFLREVNTHKNDSLFLASWRIYITASASLEGRAEYNRRLARSRAKALHDYVARNITLPDSVIVTSEHVFDWSLLANLISSSPTPSKAKALEIIATAPETEIASNGEVVYERIRRLRNLAGGATWAYMYRNHFPLMRYARIVVAGKKEVEKAEADSVVIVKEEPEPVVAPEPQPEPEVVVAPVPPPTPEPQPEPVPAPEPDNSWHRHLYVKTNVLGLMMSNLNAAVEVDIMPQLSFSLPIYYSGIDYFTRTVKFRTFSVQPELRYWFFKQQKGNDRLFAGAHFGMAYYNIATDGEYRIQDRGGRRPALGGGLSVGYRLHLGKSKRWNMEFSLGAGVYDVQYDKFYNEKNGKLAETVKRTYIGLDNVAVSVGYTFDLNKKR